MLHTKFTGNLPTGSREEDLNGFLPYRGVAAILVMSSDFLYLKAFIQSLAQIGTVVSGKIQFKFCIYTTLGQGQEMTLTFNTNISSYIQFDVCSY